MRFFKGDSKKPDLFYFIEIIRQLQPTYRLQDAKTYSEPCQTYVIELFVEIVNG